MQLTKVTAADGSYTEFSYDANGIRTQKRQFTSDGTLAYDVDYVWQDGLLTHQNMIYYLRIMSKNETRVVEIPFSAKFVYDESNTPVGCLVNDEAAVGFVRNLQGDIIATVTHEGDVLAEYSYDPWGKVTVTCDGEEFEGMEAALMALYCPFAYRGYNYDYTTGLYYLQSRYYNPEWGRFLNVDDTNILLSTQGENLGANLFAYCENNPINNVDYTGYSSQQLTALTAFVYGLYTVAMLEFELGIRGIWRIMDYPSTVSVDVDFKNKIISTRFYFYVEKTILYQEFYAVTVSVGLTSDWWNYRNDMYQSINSDEFGFLDYILSGIGIVVSGPAGVLVNTVISAYSSGMSEYSSSVYSEIEDLTQVLYNNKSNKDQLLTIVSEVAYVYRRFLNLPGDNSPLEQVKYISPQKTYIFYPPFKRIVK